jgi:hypothetical protein
LLGELARALSARGVRGLGLTNLKLCRQFYQTYPALLAHEAATWQQLGVPLPAGAIGQTLSDQLPPPNALPGLAPTLLLSRLSFSHFIELLKLDTPLQRAFYEVQAVKNNWSVRELKHALDSLLYERTGLSTDRATVLAAHAGTQPLMVADVVKNPMYWSFWAWKSGPAIGKATWSRRLSTICRPFWWSWVAVFALRLGKSASPSTTSTISSTWSSTTVF